MFCQLYVDSVEKYLSAAHATAECGAMMEGHRHQVFQAQAPLVLYIFFGCALARMLMTTLGSQIGVQLSCDIPATTTQSGVNNSLDNTNERHNDARVTTPLDLTVARQQ